MKKVLFFSFFYLIFFSVVNTMKQPGLNSILKKSDDTMEKRKKKKGRVQFNNQLVTRIGEGWLPEVTLKLYYGVLPDALMAEGFENKLIKKALEYSFDVDASFNFLLQFPNAPCKELVDRGFSRQSVDAANLFLYQVYVHTKYCIINNKTPNELGKSGLPEKMVQKVSNLVARVRKIWKTSQTSGHPEIAVRIAKELSCIKKTVPVVCATPVYYKKPSDPDPASGPEEYSFWDEVFPSKLEKACLCFLVFLENLENFFTEGESGQESEEESSNRRVSLLGGGHFYW